MENDDATRILRLLDSVEKDADINEALQLERDVVRRRLFHDEHDNNELGGEQEDSEEDNVHVSDHNSETSQSGEEEVTEEQVIGEGLSGNRNISLPSAPNTQLQYIGRDQTSKWSYFPKSNAGRGRRQRRNIVTHLPGPIRQAKNVTTPTEAWDLFFPEEDLQKIVDYTNIWITRNRVNFSRERDAKDIDIIELKAVIGLLYLAGTLKGHHTNLKDLWASDGTGVERFRLTMSLSRFTFLLRALRFDNITDREERRKEDRLAPVREMFEGFVAKCIDNYSPSEYLTIDESLEAFRGRCQFRQYIPNKPAKYGLKLFVLTDARTFYAYNMELYPGKQPNGRYEVNNSPKEIVLRLIRPVSGSGRNITTDNWYTSMPLAEELVKNHNLTLVGTIRKNKREIPPLFLEAKSRPVNSTIFGFQADTTLLSYVPKKNKVVLLVSTMHNTDTIDASSGEACKPEILTFYNLTKSGVDVHDEMKGSYSVSRTSNRWSLTIFYSLLNTAGINSYLILTTKAGNEELNRREFLKSLSLDLCKDLLEQRLTVRSLRQDVRFRLKQLLGTAEEGQNIRHEAGHGRCAFCDRKKNRKSKTSCAQCNVFICREHTSFTCVRCAGVAEGSSDRDEDMSE